MSGQWSPSLSAVLSRPSHRASYLAAAGQASWASRPDGRKLALQPPSWLVRVRVEEGGGGSAMVSVSASQKAADSPFLLAGG